MGFVLNSLDMSESIAQGLLEKAMIREVAQRIALMVSSLPRVDYGNPYQRVPMANSTNPCSSRSKQRQVFFSWWISKRSIVTRKIHHILLSDVSTQGLGPGLSNSTSGDEEEGGGRGRGKMV